jgi:hypothetical protein
MPYFSPAAVPIYDDHRNPGHEAPRRRGLRATARAHRRLSELRRASFQGPPLARDEATCPWRRATVQDVQYVRLYADAAGESHFEDVSAPLSQIDFSPPTRR